MASFDSEKERFFDFFAVLAAEEVINDKEILNEKHHPLTLVHSLWNDYKSLMNFEISDCPLSTFKAADECPKSKPKNLSPLDSSRFIIISKSCSALLYLPYLIFHKSIFFLINDQDWQTLWTVHKFF